MQGPLVSSRQTTFLVQHFQTSNKESVGCPEWHDQDCQKQWKLLGQVRRATRLMRLIWLGYAKSEKSTLAQLWNIWAFSTSKQTSMTVWQSDNEFVQLQAHGNWMQIDGGYIFCSSLQSFFLQGFTACLWRKCEHLLLSWFLPLPWWKLVCEKPTLEEIAPKEEAATKEDAVSKDGKDCHQGKSKLHKFAWALVWAYPSHRYGVVAFVLVFLIISLNGHSDPSDWFRAPFK